MEIYMSSEEVQNLLNQMETHLAAWERDLSFLRRLKNTVTMFFDAPMTADYLAALWQALAALEDEIENARSVHQKAKREMEEWLQMDQAFHAALFERGAGDAHAIDPNDISQGALGDCFFVGSLAAVALQNPQFLMDHIIDNGDGTYTVIFYDENGNPSPEIVTDEDFRGVRTGSLDKNELWPRIYEKAYAQRHGGYDVINEGGVTAKALEEITGQPSHYYDMSTLSAEDIHTALEQGQAVVVSTKAEQPSSALVGRHAYYVSGVDVEKGVVYLRNPWGWDRGETAVPISEFENLFNYVASNSITG